jgi:hypothetical protein
MYIHTYFRLLSPFSASLPSHLPAILPDTLLDIRLMLPMAISQQRHMLPHLLLLLLTLTLITVRASWNSCCVLVKLMLYLKIHFIFNCSLQHRWSRLQLQARIGHFSSRKCLCQLPLRCCAHCLRIRCPQIFLNCNIIPNCIIF